MILRDYQAELVGQTELQWALDNPVVLVQLSTGGGKTAIISQIIQDHNGFVAAIAHRDRLVEQISMTLAAGGIRHDIIASDKTIRLITRKHVKKLGACWYVPGARCRVASIDTLIRRDDLDKWAAQVTLWLVDEGHHVLRANKWGRGVAKFTHPACRGLLLTATPGRPDGKGLGRHADGYADVMVCGPPMRWLIDEGYLCDYDVVCPPSDLRPPGEPPAGGEYSPTQQRTAARNSHIVGDVPRHYLRFAAGLSGITFCGDIETATDTVAAYRAAGVSAELITGDTDPTIRDQIFERSEAGTLNQIVAVDVISEGVDIPALQVGSFARLTASIVTWLQQLGRLLRPMATPAYLAATTREERLAAIAASPKPRALLIDHIGGFVNPLLGPPDKPREWSLDRREKRGKADDGDIPDRICTNPKLDCFHPYSRMLRACPKCGYGPEPMGRSTPDMVDGDLQLMDPAALAMLQGRVLDVAISREQFDAEQLAKGARSNWLAGQWADHHRANQWQIALRDSMDRWAGQMHAGGHADHEIQRAFYLMHGVDVVSAQALSAREAEALKIRVDAAVNRN